MNLIRVLTALLVVIALVNRTSAPVTISCTALETILIVAHLHVRVLEKQHRRQGGQLEGFSRPRYKRIRS